MTFPWWQNLLGVMLGGACGAACRYLTGVGLQRLLADTPWVSFPWATLSVNLVGCFLLAIVATLGTHDALGPFWVLTFGTGFIGALTTFSTFELDAHTLLQGAHTVRASVYVLANLLLGYVMVLLGQSLALRVLQGAGRG